MDAVSVSVAGSGRKDRSRRKGTRIIHGMENERAGAEQDGRTYLARPNSSIKIETAEMSTTSRIGNRTRWNSSLLKVMKLSQV